MDSDRQENVLRLTIDEIGPDHDDIPLATLVTDAGEILTVPLHLLPDGARVGDVLLTSFELDPDERRRRMTYISDLQRRLFG